MVIVYLLLLLAGIGCFAMHYLAQYRLATLLRQHHPQQWQIIAQPDQGKPSRLRTWLRLQNVLRTQITALFDDALITGWHRVWRYSQWVAWLCWLAALTLQWAARR